MNINQLIKGIIVGIAKIIPGFSGAVLMISFNLYDRAIYAITHFFENSKRNFWFLLNLGIGIVLGVVLFSKIIHYFITKYYLYTTALFLGLIIGGIPIIARKVPFKKKYLLLVGISFLLIFSLSFVRSNQDYVLKNTYVDFFVFFVSGLLESIGTVLPGISSTALLMLIGVYNHYLVILSGALNINYLIDTLTFIVPFSLGFLIGIVLVSLLVNYLFCQYKTQTYSLILGVSIASIFLLGKDLVPFVNNFGQLSFSVILLIVGYSITNKLE